MNFKLLLEVGLLSGASLLQGAGFSLIAPFYPKEALDRGNTATHVGIVVGAYQLVMFLSSPYFGWALSQRIFAPKFLLWTGLVLDGLSSVAFGFVIFTQNPTLFFLLSLVLRVVQSLGNSASMTCYYTILGAEFPSLIGSLIPIIETAFSIGLVIGPFLGGIVNGYLGYTMTFVIFGSSLGLLGFACAMIFPEPPVTRANDLSLRKTLKDTRVDMNVILFIVALMCIGFNDATFAVNLETAFDLAPTSIGLMFIPCGLAQAIFSPLWGKLAGDVSQPRRLCAIGTAFCIAGFIVCGPSPLLPLKPSIELAILGQLLLGVGVGAIYIPAFIDTINHCINALRYPDEVATYALLAGILTAALCFGSAVGASGGGALLDLCGYPWATQFMVVVLALTAITTIVYSPSVVPTREGTPLV